MGKKKPKVLEAGESTFRNGGDADWAGGAICGGVVSKSMFDSDPWAYMMAYYMDDDKFEVYKKLRASSGKADQKSADEWFSKYAHSAI